MVLHCLLSVLFSCFKHCSKKNTFGELQRKRLSKQRICNRQTQNDIPNNQPSPITTLATKYQGCYMFYDRTYYLTEWDLARPSSLQ